NRSAGMVTPTPKAMLSPALPAVWTTLFSRIVALRTPNDLENTRKRVIDSTAMGTEAETVSPTLSTRYSDEAPKMMPRTVPASTAGQVNSWGASDGGMNGSCGGVSGEPDVPGASTTAALGSADMKRLGSGCCGAGREAGR